MNVGDVRRATAGLPDDAPIVLAWTDGPPADDEPRVTVDRFDKGFDVLPNLTVWVSLQHLDDFDDEDICEVCGGFIMDGGPCEQCEVDEASILY